MVEKIDHPKIEDGYIVPSHYFGNKYEVIDIMEANMTEKQFIGAMKGFIIKYLFKKGECRERYLTKSNYYMKELINYLSKTRSYDESKIHPDHFSSNPIEPIDIMKDQFDKEEYEGLCMGMILRYLLRAEKKHGLEDYVKCSYYLDKLIESVKGL